MLRLPVSCLVPALLAALPLAARAQTPADSVVRTTVTTVTTTTTVTKPVSAAGRPAPPATTSSSSSTTTTTTIPAPTPPPAANPAPASASASARQPGPGDLTGARPRATTKATTPATATTAPAATKAPTVKTTASATKARTTTATAPAASRAATTTATAARPASAAQTPARRPAAPADPELAHLLQTDVDPAKVAADQLPNLYERFLETTRAERRQWTSAQWTSAGAALSRLNQRYEQVRGDLSLEDKLNIRTLQGEFRGLEAAKQVSKRL